MGRWHTLWLTIHWYACIIYSKMFPFTFYEAALWLDNLFSLLSLSPFLIQRNNNNNAHGSCRSPVRSTVPSIHWMDVYLSYLKQKQISTEETTICAMFGVMRMLNSVEHRRIPIGIARHKHIISHVYEQGLYMFVGTWLFIHQMLVHSNDDVEAVLRAHIKYIENISFM